MLVVENCYLPYKFSESWVIWVDLNPLVQSHNYAPIKPTTTLRPHHSYEEYFFLIEILVELTK